MTKRSIKKFHADLKRNQLRVERLEKIARRGPAPTREERRLRFRSKFILKDYRCPGCRETKLKNAQWQLVDVPPGTVGSVTVKILGALYVHKPETKKPRRTRHVTKLALCVSCHRAGAEEAFVHVAGMLA